MAVLALLLACSSSPTPAPPSPTLLEQGWIAAVVQDPAAFSALIGADRDGWVALHRNDWQAAEGASAPVQARARAELAELHRVLAALSEQTWITLGARWDTHGGPPAGSALPLLVWAAAVDAKDTGTAEKWRAKAASAGTGGVAPRARDTDPLAAGTDPLEPAAARHRAARTGAPGADLAGLRLAAASPLLVEASSPAERHLWDPWVHRSLATAYASPGGPTPTEGLAAVLFSGTLGPADVALDATISALGIALPGGPDDAEACREVVRALDARVDPWATQLGTTATDDGKALLHDLQLVPATRARALVHLAAEALSDQRPACALAYAEMARDHAQGRAITAINSPTLYAVLASANLRTGRTREALDALEPLAGAFPEVHGLAETLGDLAVLEGIHRAGDSREN